MKKKWFQSVYIWHFPFEKWLTLPKNWDRLQHQLKPFPHVWMNGLFRLNKLERKRILAKSKKFATVYCFSRVIRAIRCTKLKMLFKLAYAMQDASESRNIQAEQERERKNDSVTSCGFIEIRHPMTCLIPNGMKPWESYFSSDSTAGHQIHFLPFSERQHSISHRHREKSPGIGSSLNAGRSVNL